MFKNMFKNIIKLCIRLLLSPEKYARYLGAKIGQDCYISTKCFSSEAYLIEIGNYVRIASKTTFYTHGGIWTLRKLYNNSTLDYFGKIKIGDYTYIGENCMIMPGVTIGSKCIIGAGTIVTKNIPDGCIVAGNPCRFVGMTDDFYKKILQFDTKTAKKTHNDKKKMLLKFPEDSFIKKDNLRFYVNKQ